MPRKKVGRKIDVNGTLQDLGNTLSDADLEKFDTIERNAQKNVQADWNEIDTSSSSYIRNKPSYDSWILGEFEKTSNLYFTPINSNSITLDFINNDLYRAGKLEDSYTMSMTLGKKYTLSFDAYLLDYADASTLWANVKLDNISIQKQGISSGYYKLNTQNYTIGIGASNYTHISFTFTAPINVEDVTTSSLYFGFNKYSGSNIVGYPDKGLIVYIKNVMLNEGETALSYSIPFGQLLWTRDVVGVYAKEEDVPDESKLGSQLSLSLNQSDYKLTVKLLNSSDVVLSSKVVDLPLEEMVVDASYDSTTKEINLELKNGNTTSFSVADLVSGLVPTTRKINNKALITDITLTQDDVGDGTTYKRVTATEKTNWNNKSDFSGSYKDLTDKPTIPDVSKYLPLAGGTLTGTVNMSNGDFLARYVGISAAGHETSTYDKIAIISNTTNGYVRYRTKSELKSDLGVPTNYATKSEGVYYVEGNTTGTEGVWTGTNSRITSYYDGLVVNFKVGIAGISDGTTLNINGLGAKPCYLRGTTKVTTHYAVGTLVMFSYSADADAFYSSDYDANNYAYARQYGNVTTNSNFPILFSKSATIPSTYTNNYTSSQSGFTYNPSTKTLTATNIKGTTLYENGTSLVNKYLGKTAKASDSDKLDGNDSSYYVNTDDTTYKFAQEEYNKSVNLFNVSLLNGISGIAVSNNGATITMPLVTSGNGAFNTGRKLKEFCPSMEAGKTYFLKFNRSHEDGNDYIILGGSNYWWNNSSETITQADLDSDVYVYGNRYSSGYTQQITMTNFMVNEGSTALPYQPYNGEILHKADITPIKIWENANINSSFSSQVVTMSQNFDDAKGFIVVYENYQYQTLLPEYKFIKYTVGVNTDCFITGSRVEGSSNILLTRRMYLSGFNKIGFDNAYYNNTANNAFLIPLAVFKIV